MTQIEYKTAYIDDNEDREDDTLLFLDGRQRRQYFVVSKPAMIPQNPFGLFITEFGKKLSNLLILTPAS